MYTFFFTILFIAEVIITVHIVAFIIKCDRKVCEINYSMTGVKEILPDILGYVKGIVSNASLNVSLLKKTISDKKNKYKFFILKHVITGLLFVLLNTKGKKIITFVELLFAFREFIDSAYKSMNKLKR